MGRGYVATGDHPTAAGIQGVEDMAVAGVQVGHDVQASPADHRCAGDSRGVDVPARRVGHGHGLTEVATKDETTAATKGVDGVALGGHVDPPVGKQRLPVDLSVDMDSEAQSQAPVGRRPSDHSGPAWSPLIGAPVDTGGGRHRGRNRSTQEAE